MPVAKVAELESTVLEQLRGLKAARRCLGPVSLHRANADCAVTGSLHIGFKF